MASSNPKYYNGAGSSNLNFNGAGSSNLNFNGAASSNLNFNGAGSSNLNFNGAASSNLNFNGAASSNLDYNGAPSINLNYNGAPSSNLDYNGLASSNLDYNGAPSINLDVDVVQSLLELVENIVKDVPKPTQGNFSFDSIAKPGLGQLIQKITWEISYDCAGKGSAHEKANSLLGLLSNYSADAKIVLVLAAFAIQYGNFMVVNQHSRSDEFVNSLVILKQFIGTLEDEDKLKSQIATIKNIINKLLDVVHCIIELKSFPSWSNILSEIGIDEITFCMIKSVIHCGFTVSDLCSGYTLRFKENPEFKVLTMQITCYYEQLTTHIERYSEIRKKEEYKKILGLLLLPPASNIEILYWLISSSIDSNVLYKPRTQVSTTLRSSFKDKKVLILYSSFATDTFEDELSFLKNFYNNNDVSGYEMVWVPIVDKKNTIDEEKYNEIISEMSWYTLTYEAVQQVNIATVHLLQKDWGFTGKPMLVVLDERGRVVRQNALLMLHLYGKDAFPFTLEHESLLIKRISWGMQFLLEKNTDDIVSQWMKIENRFVCLYGGDDFKWCKDLVQQLTTFTDAAKITVETAYVGRYSHHQEEVEAKLTAFKEAIMGYSFAYSKSMAFWERVEKSVLHFHTHETSDISGGFLSRTTSLLTFDNSRDSWVAIGNAKNMLVFRGSVFLSGLKLISQGITDGNIEVSIENFLQVLDERLKDNKRKKHCHKLEIVGNAALIRGDVHCPTCNELMHQATVLYKCCKVNHV